MGNHDEEMESSREGEIIMNLLGRAERTGSWDTFAAITTKGDGKIAILL